MAYRILSLDGGGTWALIEVRALIKLYGADATGHEVLRDFDLVAANSGGSLVLGGLIEDMKLQDLLNCFKDPVKRRSLFPPSLCYGTRLLHVLTGLGPKYSTKRKLTSIQTLLPKTGNKPLAAAVAGLRGAGGANLHVLIVGFDYDRCRAVYFRSATAYGTTNLGVGAATRATLAQAIHASTNAPVNYFDAPARFPGHNERYWDGGLTGNNNPVLAAVTEAAVLEQRPEDVIALSLGTGSVFLPMPAPGTALSTYETPRKPTSLVRDLKKLALAILDDPPDAASFHVHVMTGSGSNLPSPAVSRLVRMNPLLSPVRDTEGQWAPPGGMSGEEFLTLCDLGMDALAQDEVDRIGRLADLWLVDKVRNQPIRLNGSTLDAEIGYESFGAARAGWEALTGTAPTKTMKTGTKKKPKATARPTKKARRKKR
ncbi:MAG TPA: patatin-like phospholipase family protein [Gammaproteobacteria bacterium]|nr:patatin-like phospholipase family protein [Gammaproteobacteria bacterium]